MKGPILMMFLLATLGPSFADDTAATVPAASEDMTSQATNIPDVNKVTQTPAKQLVNSSEIDAIFDVSTSKPKGSQPRKGVTERTRQRSHARKGVDMGSITNTSDTTTTTTTTTTSTTTPTTTALPHFKPTASRDISPLKSATDDGNSTVPVAFAIAFSLLVAAAAFLLVSRRTCEYLRSRRQYSRMDFLVDDLYNE